VVAADKGTATFSDTANALAVAHGLWLGDAFASGGSHGYDHKALGITALVGTAFSFSFFVQNMITMIGLAVGIDYSLFVIARYREERLHGRDKLEAIGHSGATANRAVFFSGMTVVLALLGILIVPTTIFRALAAGAIFVVLVAVAASMTLLPAMLALLGRRIFWPGVRAEQLGTSADDFSSPVREAGARFVSSLPVSVVLVVLCSGLLALAASGISDTKLAFRLITGLPSDTQQRRAAEAAGLGFAPGVLAPTVLLVEGGADGERRGALVKLEETLAKEEGVAAVIGPREQIPQAPDDLFATADGSAARFVVIFEESPLGSEAIGDFRRLENRLPELLSGAGLEGSESGLTGQTALASETVEAVVGSSLRVGAVVLAVNFLLLALFLRALVAPLYLLAASVASVAATLGLTTYVFQDLLGHSDLTYYIPFAAGVLLVSLGSDYNVYVVGRIWEELRVRPVREAIAVAIPRASKAISVAGIALALSFAVLAIVPLDAFRELAFMMSVGVLLETFLVRTLLIPALISVFGRTSTWPGRVRPSPDSG